MNILNFTRHTRSGYIGYVPLLVAITLTLAFAATSANAVSVSGGKGASLSSIVGSPTLVTVVIRGGAKDPNLQVLEIQPTAIVFSSEAGDRISYQKTDISEIIIQGSVVEKRPVLLSSTVALRPEDKSIVDGASARVAELFQGSKDNQELRIWAAAYMAFHDSKEAADYLNSLATSNNLQTQLDAAWGLYLADKPLPEGLVRTGLESNNRTIRSQAAVLAGLYGMADMTPELMGMLNDRSAEFSAPAALALARIGNREIIPQLFEMLASTSGQKNQAGVQSLITLGGPDVIDIVKYRIEETDGLERYRLIYILHQLGEPAGRKHLIDVFNDEPTIRAEAALVLAADDYWEAIQYLQERLKRREDPTLDNLIFRARNAHGILQSGDSSAIHVFQSLLRSEDKVIKSFVLDLIIDLADRSHLKLIQPSIRNVDSALSLKACNAAVSIANPAYRERYQNLTGTP